MGIDALVLLQSAIQLDNRTSQSVESKKKDDRSICTLQNTRILSRNFPLEVATVAATSVVRPSKYDRQKWNHPFPY